MLWFIYIGLILIVFYEMYAAITKKYRTISQMTWTGIDRHPKLTALSTLGIGMLIGHLWL